MYIFGPKLVAMTATGPVIRINPKQMLTDAMNLPAEVSGTRSPYPTVVSVTRENQRALGMVSKSGFSESVMYMKDPLRSTPMKRNRNMMHTSAELSFNESMRSCSPLMKRLMRMSRTIRVSRTTRKTPIPPEPPSTSEM